MATTPMIRVAIVGCGLVGAKRAASIPGGHLTVACDLDQSRARRLADKHPGCRATSDAMAATTAPDVDVVIVASTNDALASLTHQAILAGKHVLVEKPGARSARELEPLLALARAHDRIVKVGFNHRFHPGVQKMRALVDAGLLGPLMFLRARYGHGGRVGYDKEWRADPERAGGGELLDQGVHLIDLARWCLGDFTDVQGSLGTFYWDMPVEDNAFLLLRTREERVAFLHASCTEWKNLFSLELYGRHGKLHLEGLGGSYGAERLTFHRMLPQMGPPATTTWDYPGEDTSWRDEWNYFMTCIRTGQRPDGGLEDALAVLEITARAYALPGRRRQPVPEHTEVPPGATGHDHHA